jgi:hypothetical protein
MVARFRADFAKYAAGKTLHQWSLEGWAVGYEFTQAAASMGANVTRKGFMAWLNNLHQYTMNGLFNAYDYQPKASNATGPDCNVIVQWQDAASGYVTRAAPGAYCPVTGQYATPAGNDGS